MVSAAAAPPPPPNVMRKPPPPWKRERPSLQRAKTHPREDPYETVNRIDHTQQRSQGGGIEETRERQRERERERERVGQGQ
jgi:hypothetical protein